MTVWSEPVAGHPDYAKLTREELELYNAKNQDYTKGGDPNGNFHRVAAILGNYPGLSLADPVVVCLTYALKQLDQVLWSRAQGYEGEIEGTDARLMDVHVYVKIARLLVKEK